MNEEPAIFKHFKLAIENEYETAQLYRQMAGESADDEIRKIFLKIAEDEMEHRKQIMDLYRRFKGAAGEQ